MMFYNIKKILIFFNKRYMLKIYRFIFFLWFCPDCHRYKEDYKNMLVVQYNTYKHNLIFSDEIINFRLRNINYYNF